MIKPVVLIIISAVILVFSFQNCSKKNIKDFISDSSVTVTRNSTQLYYEMKMVTQEDDVYYAINLVNGFIEKVDGAGNRLGVQYCLDQNQFNQLHAILSGAEICRYDLQINKEEVQVCTQEYVYPYSVFVAASEAIALGEKRNGCQVANDLCDSNRAANLRQWVSSSLANLKNINCHPWQ